jgi:hypothetical protein
VERRDVLVAEGGQQLGFPFKPGQPALVSSHFLRKHLDGDIPIQPLVAGPVDHPHPTRTDFLDDAVVAKRATDEVLHFLGSSAAMLSQF